VNTSRHAAVILATTLLLNARVAHAQFIQPNTGGAPATENIQGFTVAGKGSVSAKPNAVEIDLEVSAASELTADAIVKYRDTRKRVREAFTALKLENLAIEERGLLVDQKGMMPNYYFGYQPNQRTKTEVELKRKLVVKGTGIRTMDEERILQMVAKLLDVAQDAGAHVGTQPEFNPYYGYNPYNRFNQGLVRFVLDDFDKLQEEAYQKAIQDARTRAERLARLSQVELGPIVAVREIRVPGEIGPESEDETHPKRLVTSKFQEIPVRVELLVRFDVHPSAKNQGRAGDR
jgi:uncharacterized protein YggE